MDQSDPYMWYKRVTRVLIGNPAIHRNTGYQGVGGAMETMAQSLQKIYHCATDAIHEGYEVSGKDVLREIQKICAYSLRAAHEDRRLILHPDMEAASPSISPFVPLKVQRGRPRKMGALISGQAADIRRGGSYGTGVPSTSSALSHSFKPSNLSEVPDTPGTWDTVLSAPLSKEDNPDPNVTPLDQETTYPMVQALEKIRGICAFTLGMNNQNQAIPLTHDIVPYGPKMKHCKPRRGGINGFLLGATSGVNSYCPSTSSAFSPIWSTSLGHMGSPLQRHDSPERDVEPLSRNSLLPELHDNLQLEMIEIDIITGSREASPSPNPSMLNLPCDPPGNQDSDLMMAGVKTCFPPKDDTQIQTGSVADDSEAVIAQEKGNEVLPPVPETPTLKPYSENFERPEHGDTATLNGTPFAHEDDPSASEDPKLQPDIPTLPDTIEEGRGVNGLDTQPTPKPLELEPQEADNLNSISQGMVNPSSHLADKNTSSPTHQDCSGETVKVGELDGDIFEGGKGKRKRQATDNVATASSDVNASSFGPDNSRDYGKSPF